MIEQPLISIVTPSFNKSEFLEETINSVLSQSYPNLEYIIIDGGSTDGSIDIIKKYEKHLAYWCSEPDQGQYDAINKGFATSKGEIMAWLNVSDIYYPWTFRTVASIMSQFPEIEWMTTMYPGNIDFNSYSLEFGTLRGFSKDAFLESCFLPWEVNLAGIKWRSGIGFIQQESTFWRRSLWQRSGGCIDTSYALSGDFDLWAKFFRYSELYGVCSPLAGFRFHEEQKSEKLDVYEFEANRSLAELRKLSNFSPNYFRRILLNLRTHRFHFFHKLSKYIFGYSGKRIVRKNVRNALSYWEIEEYKFL